MTLASRVEVYTELSCRQLYTDFDHTSAPELRGVHASVRPPLSATPSVTPTYLLSMPSPARSLEESQGDGASEGDDPRVIPGEKCVSDPAVQARAARLQTIMTTTMGALSALTTGWWGRFSERHGRTRVLAISTFGLFLTYVPILPAVELAELGASHNIFQGSNFYSCLHASQLTRCPLP